MEYVLPPSTLVIVGGWNANIILNPQWLKKYLFPEQDQIKIGLNPSSAQPIIVSTDGLHITLGGNKLGFAPSSQSIEALDAIEQVAKKIADYLPHTPVTAFGINFSREEDHTTVAPFLETRLKSFIGLRYGQARECSVKVSFTVDKSILRFTVRQDAAGKSFVDFNFHHQIQSLSDFKGIVSEFGIPHYKSKAESIWQTLSGALSGEGDGGSGEG